MAKSLIFLFDGTANDATSVDTDIDTYSNVYRINQLIAESREYTEEKVKKHRTQVTFYLPGVGSRFTVWRPKKFSFFRLDRVRQKIFGEGAEQLILRAYINLCSNYKVGDDIILVGFSRGAAAARIFSRLISDFGILTSERLSLLDRLWNEFVQISSLPSDEAYFEAIKELKSEIENPQRKVFHSDDTNQIKFMGLFDTVIGALDTDLRKSLDFRDNYPASGVRSLIHLLSMHDVRKEFEFQRFDRRAVMPEEFREMWLPGVHSDVGGGYQLDFISNVSLLTMAYFLKKYGGVAIDPKAHEHVERKIKAAVESGNVAVNREPFVTTRESRHTQIYATDELHPLHDYLDGREVKWKSARLAKYENRFQNNRAPQDGALVKEFQSWVTG